MFIETIILVIQFLKSPLFWQVYFHFPLVKKVAFLIKIYFVASMGAKVEVLAHPGDKYCEDRQAG